MNLAAIPLLADAFGCPVGLSDHSMGTTAPIVAVTLGARFVEKHFTLSRADGGVDSHFSLEPSEFAKLVEDVRRAESMLGSIPFGVSSAERASSIFRRSLYVVEDIEEGVALSRSNVRAIRPGHGLSPRHLEAVLGFRAPRRLERGTPLTWDLLKGSEGA
jgi:sialic acid synthase SpsE